MAYYFVMNSLVERATTEAYWSHSEGAGNFAAVLVACLVTREDLVGNLELVGISKDTF